MNNRNFWIKDLPRLLFSDSALDADWDARLGYEPTEAQWHDREYRAAYIQAIAQKYDEKFGDLI